MKAGYTHISFVLDRSGSMSSCATDTEGGFNTFIEGQKKVEGTATFTMVQFDNVYEIVHDAIDIQSVPKLKFEPRGQTALLDAIGKTILSTGEFLKNKAEDDRPEHVIFAILTDGYENASKEFKTEQINEMIKRQTDVYKWHFVYLGANQDAIAVGGKLGVMASNSVTYDSAKIGSTYSVLESNMKALRSNKATSMAFSKEDRKKTRK